MSAPRFVAVIAAALLLTGCNDKSETKPPVRPVMSTVIAPLQATNLAVVGTVEPQFKTDYGFRMLGRLIARPVNIGDVVEKGQTLAAVDPFAAELAVRSAQADLAKIGRAHV